MSVKSAQDMAPPKHILSNPRLLTDTTSQRTVVDNVHRDQLSRLANTLSGCVKVAKVLGSSNLIPLGEGPDIEELNAAKNHCKLAIGMEYFLRKLIVQPPAPEEVPRLAAEIETTLQSKGVLKFVPPFVRQALQELKKPPAVPEAPA